VFERFTDRARRVLVLAQEEARLLDHNFIGTEHILLGLIHEDEGVAAKALADLGVSLDAVRQKVAEVVGPGSSMGVPGSPPFTPRAKKVLELSLREALQLGHNYIGTEHLLLGLVREGDGVAAQVLVSLGADLSRVRQQVIQVLSGHPGGHLPAVRGERVERTDVPFGAAALVAWDDASAVLLAGVDLADAHTTRVEVDGVVYETCTYRPGPLPEISVSVAAAAVTREAFDDFTARISDAEHIDGLGDAATYSTARNSLRVLAGSTLFVVQLRHHPHPRVAAMAAAQRALANIARESPPAGAGESASDP
jgi:Clp amino terminal domain, pathogenicity island component